jgi:hypothetical protein
MFLVLGVICFSVAILLLPASFSSDNQIPSGTWIGFLITGLILGYMIWNVARSMKKGHKLLCSLRGIVLDIAK